MEDLRKVYRTLTSKEISLHVSKALLEKYVEWYKQLGGIQKEKELRNLLKNDIVFNTRATTLVREYQGKKYEVSIIDGDFFYTGIKYKSLSNIAREITGTNWNGKLFFGVKN